MLNLTAVMAHSSGSYRNNTPAWAPSRHVCQQEMRGDGLCDSVLLQGYFKQFAVSTWESRHSSSPAAAGVLRFHFNFLFFLYQQAQRGWDSLFRYSWRRKERPLLVMHDKNFSNRCNSVVIKYSIFRHCWFHGKWTLNMFDSAACEMAQWAYMMDVRASNATGMQATFI